MNKSVVCKYCKKFKIVDTIYIICLIIKHIAFFIRAFLYTLIMENLILTAIVIILIILTKFILTKFLNDVDLLYGAYLGILITANLQMANDLYRKDISWDGDWKIFTSEKYNFEHKKGIYISLCGVLSDIVAMITNNFGEPYRSGRIITIKDYTSEQKKYNLNRLENFIPNFNKIDEIGSYEAFTRYVKSFYKIDNVISSLQNIQNHLNIYCPSFNVKSTMALLLNELFVTLSYNQELSKFIKNTSVYDDADKWKNKLMELLSQKQINIDALNNNVKNLITCLSLIYKDINNDCNLKKIQNNN